MKVTIVQVQHIYLHTLRRREIEGGDEGRRQGGEPR